MGLCTFFCFYGTFALVWDRKHVAGDRIGSAVSASLKYQHKQSDVLEELEGQNDVGHEFHQDIYDHRPIQHSSS